MKRKVLIVEDEKNLARFLELELRHEGWDVSIAPNGREGIRLLETGNWSILVLDVMLPDLSGLEVCRRIRSQSDVPIIMLTARDAVPDRVSGLDAGADDYMTKPFAIEELLARMRALLRRNRGDDPEAVLVNGPCCIYPEERRVTVRGDEVKFTTREFDLFLYLMENRDRVKSREQIIAQVWRFEYSGDTNVVDVYIRYIRNKLAAAGVTGMIETVRGVGYVIREVPDAD
ncbi:MAG: response regulator transcription factor [Firmicutes bacterium]|nr:response regulator transcription factor [Bacillota bacterium]